MRSVGGWRVSPVLAVETSQYKILALLVIITESLISYFYFPLYIFTFV